MKSAIQTLTDGLVYCKNYLRDNPNCSGQNKRIKQQQIVEHEKAINILHSRKILTNFQNAIILDCVNSNLTSDDIKKLISKAINKKRPLIVENINLILEI